MGTTGAIPPGWYADPTDRHLYRWWAGTEWTDLVGDGAAEFHDAAGLEAHPTPATETPTWSGPGRSVATPAPAVPRSGRGWLIGGLVAGGVVLLTAIVVLLIAGRAATGNILDEDFSDGPGPFSTDSDNYVEFEAINGGYQVTLKDGSPDQEARFFFDPSRSAIAVTATVTETEAPAASAAGITCYLNAQIGYRFVVSSDRVWAIVKVDIYQGTNDVLARGTSETGLSSQAITLHLSCTGGATDPTVITGQVDDGPVHTAEDDEGYDQFRAAGFFAAAEETPSILVFDDMVVKDAS